MGIAFSAFVQDRSSECRISLPLQDIEGRADVSEDEKTAVPSTKVASVRPDISPEYFHHVFSTAKGYIIRAPSQNCADDEDFDDFMENSGRKQEYRTWFTPRTITINPHPTALKWGIRLLLVCLGIPLLFFLLYMLWLYIVISSWKF